MTPLFQKLNLKTQTRIHVLDAPPSFEPELAALDGIQIVRKVAGNVDFALAFVITQAELDTVSTQLTRAATGDAILWMVYPKGTSKKYRCEFNRDSGWTVLGAAGYEPVRMVAVDDDWSALRFRRSEHVKTMTRNPAAAISKAGRQKASATRKAAKTAVQRPTARPASTRKRPPR